MLKNYFKTAWRGLKNSKTYGFLNIVGLATGLAVALIIGLWVYYQFSFDRFLPGYTQVYKAGTIESDNGDKYVQLVTPYPLGEAIKKDIPGIKYVTHTDWIKKHGLVAGETKLYLNGAMAGSDFLKIFRYPLLKGSADHVLTNTYSIVLTESTAKALFGLQDPMNKIVRIDNQHDLKVTGVLRDVPKNSTLQFNYIVPIDYLVQTNNGVKRATTNWGAVTFHTYVALEPNVSYEGIEPALSKLIGKYNPSDGNAAGKGIMLHPMKDWHLYADFKNMVPGGFIEYVKLFGLIGILVLLIACINFINLSTARSEKRAKEVGIRKVIGSQRRELILQYLVEAVIITFIAFLLSLVFVQLALPAFNDLTSSAVKIPYSSGIFWLMMAGYILLIGMLAGSRPAFYFSSFKPIKVLKGGSEAGKGGLLPRKILVVTQFTCSIVLIISTMIIYQQVQYAKNRPSGYDAHRLVMTDQSVDLRRNYAVLKSDILKSGVVSSLTGSSSPVMDNRDYNSIDNWPGKGAREKIGVAVVAVSDPDYFKTMGMKILAGRNFAGLTDTVNVLLNESAGKQMHIGNPVNQIITWDGTEQARVIGIVNDALMSSPFGNPDATIFVFRPERTNILTYRLAANVNTQEAVATLTPIFNKHNPSFPYTFSFADEKIEEKFRLEVLIGKLSGVFATLAIVISCLGLFSLAAYTAEQRTKEIGIRKVLGASVSQVWMLLSKEFLFLVLLSCVIASPIALYFLQNWLEKYSYRIAIGPEVFLSASMAATFLTLVTISFQAIKAALMNPVKSIRTE